jgi:hypothetical protein
MRHLLAVGEASAKAIAAINTEETMALEITRSFMEYPTHDFFKWAQVCGRGARGRAGDYAVQS